ncbi:hypothetical protein SteCoe_10418 [Stentor coeruleus]|uniref:C2 NT-type domain-containing protein n=1 Tax=Stentor coeruleus TaxID=5963 RepID=A0A1R2CFR2_9CILI|nr:hypothetical protein SteCoe_10418 [Stentor coeruleus]
MAKLIHRIGAKSVKFELEVVIHYIIISLPEASLLKVRVKRGKDKTEETQPLRYAPNTKKVQFDYPLNFRITMYKKGNKFSKKDLKIKVLQINGKNEKIVGHTSIEFQKCAETGKFIIEENLKLHDCSDQKAVICTSVKLFEEGKPKNDFFAGNVISSNNKAPNRRAISIDTPLTLNLDFGPIDDKARKNSKARGNSFDRGVINLKNSQSYIESYDDPDFEQSELRRKKNTIKGMRSAFHLTPEELEEMTGNNKQKVKEVGIEKKEQKEEDREKKSNKEEVKVVENYEEKKDRDKYEEAKVVENYEEKKVKDKHEEVKVVENYEEKKVKDKYEEVKQEKVVIKEKKIEKKEDFAENAEIQTFDTEPKADKLSKEKKHNKKDKQSEKVAKELEENPKASENLTKTEKTHIPPQVDSPKPQAIIPHHILTSQSPPNPPSTSKNQDPIPDPPKSLIQNSIKTTENTIEKHKEPISEPHSNIKTKESPPPLPEYLKYEQQTRISVEMDLHKGLADDSSSDEAPIQVDVIENTDSFMPKTHLKQSVPNASSREEKILLKEMHAGLPSSRESTCCASCRVF